jgi:ABC-type Mn2+/Zn2+ transport system ATPase subunit
VAVTAAAGDVVAVEGVNGSGKSTLLAAAAGLLPAGQGSRHPPTVGYAPERGDTLTTLPVRRWLLGLSRHEAGVQADDLLDRLGLAHAEPGRCGHFRGAICSGR